MLTRRQTTAMSCSCSSGLGRTKASTGAESVAKCVSCRVSIMRREFYLRHTAVPLTGVHAIPIVSCALPARSGTMHYTSRKHQLLTITASRSDFSFAAFSHWLNSIDRNFISVILNYLLNSSSLSAPSVGSMAAGVDQAYILHHKSPFNSLCSLTVCRSLWHHFVTICPPSSSSVVFHSRLINKKHFFTNCPSDILHVMTKQVQLFII